MITPAYVQTLAKYNTWQNASVYAAATTLSDCDRKADRGAFFGSIHATLNHTLWADQMWMMRFGAGEEPAAKTIAEGLSAYPDWAELGEARAAFDRRIETWAADLLPQALAGELTFYSAIAGRSITRPRWLLVTHMFNHETHHRGQVNAMLTGYGVKPGVTDLPFGPPWI